MNEKERRSKEFPYIGIRLPGDLAEILSADLWEEDILGFEEQSDEGDQVILKVYFETDKAAESCRVRLRKQFPQIEIGDTGTVNYDDWISFLHGGFEPLDVDPLIIVPAEEPPPIPAGKKPLYLIPGRGFGTGSHPSTRLCLRLLVEVAEYGMKVLDVGTGSGILAVAACLLGAASVVAVDVDEDALENARDNAMRNSVDSKISFLRGSILAVESGGFDLILANIITPVLVKLLDGGMADLLAPGGWLILSGITADSVERVTSAVARVHLTEKKRLSEKEWLALSLKKQD